MIGGWARIADGLEPRAMGRLGPHGRASRGALISGRRDHARSGLRAEHDHGQRPIPIMWAKFGMVRRAAQLADFVARVSGMRRRRLVGADRTGPIEPAGRTRLADRTVLAEVGRSKWAYRTVLAELGSPSRPF